MPRKRVSPAGAAYLVGAGPGELQLLTLRARSLLERADVLVYDFLANERLLEWAPQAKTIYVGKRSGKHTLTQEEINQLLVREVRRGKQVVRLKGGDPFVFGRGGEEGRALAEAGLRFEVVPGVTSAISVPAYAGIPVTDRSASASLAIVTGHERTGKEAVDVPYDALAKLGTVVFLMGVKAMKDNFARLVAAGLDPQTPAAIIQWGTGSNQRTVTGTVADLPAKAAAANVGSPAVIVVGKVVARREALNWYESRPWFGKRIILTRSRDAAPDFVDALENGGALVVEVPSIAFTRPTDEKSLNRGIARLGSYDWVVFTSVNGVEYFWRRLREKNRDARAFGNAKVAVVGPVTARALAQYGLHADAMPDEFRGAAIAKALGRSVKGKKILLVRAEEGSEEFPAAARAAGAKLDLAIAYRTVPAKRPPGFKPIDQEGRPPALHVFASPSAVKSYQAMLKPAERKDLHGAPVACIGPVTAAAAEKAGYHVAVLPKDYTLNGLLAAMDSYFGSQLHEIGTD
jgi:uroporphyrinogen III methyltransferase/synthase